MTDIDANVLAPVVIYETCRKLLVSIRNIRPVIRLAYMTDLAVEDRDAFLQKRDPRLVVRL